MESMNAKGININGRDFKTVRAAASFLNLAHDTLAKEVRAMNKSYLSERVVTLRLPTEITIKQYSEECPK